MATAEKHNINIIMELLNSQDHKDYMCDHTPWGVELVKGCLGQEFIPVRGGNLDSLKKAVVDICDI